MSIKKTINKQGFTLLEIMVSISIIIFVSFMGANFAKTGFSSSRFINEQNTAVENARRATSIITQELRGANSSEKGDYVLNRILNQDLIYFSDTDTDGETEMIRYYLDGLQLKKTTINIDGSNNYSGTGQTEVISNFVNNNTEDIFSYYDANGNETGQINNARLIKIRLKINVTPLIMPNDYYIETDVHLRNLKDNL